MGIFTKVRYAIGKLRGVDPDSRSARIRRRIEELNSEKRRLDVHLDELRRTTYDLSWFKVTINPKNPESAPVFSNKKEIRVQTMKSLLEQRIREEEERIRRLKLNVTRSLDSASSYISNEDADSADRTLQEIYVTVEELGDESLINLHRELNQKLSTLREELRQREIQRRLEEERRRREEEERRLEEIRLQEELARQEEEERTRRAQEYDEQLAIEQIEHEMELTRLRNEYVTPRKSEGEDILNYLRMNRVQCFYHFTDKRNLSSIRRKGGLYSWAYCLENNISIPNAGGDATSRDLDRRHRLQDYVRLSFCNDHPMAFRKHNESPTPVICLLRIKIDVAAFAGTQFCNINATDNNESHGGTLDDLKKVNIPATKQNYVSRENPIFHEHQAECMVKTFIPIEYIENIDSPQIMSF